ncbi:MAG: hypothetical protein Q8R20_03400 [Nanoarchaeota archaeon]|nr:hypothetical protein [Nanoarchaeota archaeon]
MVSFFKHNARERVLMGLALVFFVPLLVLALLPSPRAARAISIFTPFGGKVKSHSFPSSCLTLISTPIAAATAGTVWATIESLELEGLSSEKVGVLRVNGFLIPGLTTIYERGGYTAPGTWVLGNTINVCDICGKVSNVPGVKKICSFIPEADKILGTLCSVSLADCPVTNLIYKMGTNARSLGPIPIPSPLDVIPGGNLIQKGIQFVKNLF